MSSFTPLVTTLNQNTLTGPNYVDWKRYLDNVLMVEGHNFVLFVTSKILNNIFKAN
jgi:hypothetical protein